MTPRISLSNGAIAAASLFVRLHPLAHESQSLAEQLDLAREVVERRVETRGPDRMRVEVAR